MSSEKPEEAKKVSRRNLLKGLGAGVLVGAVAVAGVENMMVIPSMPSKTSTVPGGTSTVTSTVPGGTSTVTSTSTTTVTGTAPAAVTATLSASSGTIQAGASVTFTATPGGGTSPYTISIDCGDGTTLTASGAHTYAAAGNYTALLTVADSKGSKAYATASLAVIAPAGSVSLVTLVVNGESYTLPLQSNWTLQDVLHDQLGITSVKAMCTGKGECGSCAVIVDGRAILSCMALAIELDASLGHSIQTAEGIATSGHPIVQSWADFDAMQCGYCAPGAVVTAKALLDKIPKPTSDQVNQALSGNLCVCGTYPQWSLATLDAASKVKGGS